MKFRIFLFAICFVGCQGPIPFSKAGRLIPAEEFSHSLKEGTGEDFSIFKVAQEKEKYAELGKRARLDSPITSKQNLNPKSSVKGTAEKAAEKGQFSGDSRYLEQGFKLKQSFAPVWSPNIPERSFQGPGEAPSSAANASLQASELNQAAYIPPPPGSSAPYANGQMTGNPSLWPDEGQGASLFRDFRAFLPMDMITVVINEISEGRKKAETDAKSEFSLTAGIANFFGIETKTWAANNEALDPANLLSAETKSDFKGEGETKRSGSLKARLSAVILEVLPNGLLRIEGTKIISVDEEEEVMVLSGLVRQRDLTADNQVDSSRVANMRIDFYGRGIVGQQQSPGWGVKVFQTIWPF